MHTDTRIERPTDDVLARIEASRRNDGTTHYRARHSTDNPPVPMVPLPQHVRTELIPAVPRELGAETQRIQVGNLRVRVPLSRETPTTAEGVPAAAVSAPPAEPVAEQPLEAVTVGLLERILRALRRKS